MTTTNIPNIANILWEAVQGEEKSPLVENHCFRLKSTLRREYTEKFYTGCFPQHTPALYCPPCTRAAWAPWLWTHGHEMPKKTGMSTEPWLSSTVTRHRLGAGSPVALLGLFLSQPLLHITDSWFPVLEILRKYEGNPSLSPGCDSTKFCGEWAPCRHNGAIGAYEDNLTFYCSFHVGLSLIVNFSSRIPIWAWWFRERARRKKRGDFKEVHLSFFPTIHSSVDRHPQTFLPDLPSSRLSLIVLEDGVWGENKMHTPINSTLLPPKSLRCLPKLRSCRISFSKESSMG